MTAPSRFGPIVRVERLRASVVLAVIARVHRLRDAGAREAFGRALACPEDHGVDGDLDAKISTRRGKASASLALLAGRPADALTTVDATLPFTAPYRERPWVQLEIAELHLARGRALHALARPDGARTALEAALHTFESATLIDSDLLLAVWRAGTRAALQRLPSP